MIFKLSLSSPRTGPAAQATPRPPSFPIKGAALDLPSLALFNIEFFHVTSRFLFRSYLGSTERGEKQKKSSNINGLRLITSGSTASLFLLCLKIILQIPKSVQQATFLQVCKVPVYLRNFVDFGMFFGYSDI